MDVLRCVGERVHTHKEIVNTTCLTSNTGCFALCLGVLNINSLYMYAIICIYLIKYVIISLCLCML